MVDRSNISDIFYILKEYRLLSQFYQETCIKNYYSSRNSFIRAMNNFSFSVVEQTYTKSIERIHLILDEFKRFSIKHGIVL